MAVSLKRLRWRKPLKDGARSAFAACRRKSIEALLKYGQITVSAYKVSDGRMFYTDPIGPKNVPGPGVLYRVRIKLKPQEQRT